MSTSEKSTSKSSNSGYVIALIIFILSLLCLGLWHNLPTIDPKKTNDIKILFELANEIKNFDRPEEFSAEYPIIVSAHPKVDKSAHDTLGLVMGPFMAMKRLVQYYIWVEEKIPEDQLPKKEKLTLIDKYKYHQEWVTEIRPYRELKVWKGHMYHIPSIKDLDIYGGPLYFGRLILNLNNAEILKWEDFKIENQYEFLKDAPHDEKYIYPREEAITNPETSEVRLHYKVLKIPEKGQPITIFGARNYNELTFYKMSNGQHILYLYPGTIEEMKDFIGHPPISVKTIKTLQVLLPSTSAILLVFSILMIILKKRKKGSNNS